MYDVGLSFVSKPHVLEDGLRRPLVAIYGISCLILTSLENQVKVTILKNLLLRFLVFSIYAVFTQGCSQIFLYVATLSFIALYQGNFSHLALGMNLPMYQETAK
jgi:hypothetical protein